MFDISMDYPAESARKLIADEVDISLIPIGALIDLSEYQIVSDYCIGAVGKVNTVKIFSEVPLDEVKSIFLDYQSRTSVLLAKILIEKYWNLKVEYLNGYPGYQKEIVGKTAGLVIGDRAIRLLGKFKYEYDLSEAWFNWQHKPFVFAAWVSNKPVSKENIAILNECFKSGLDNVGLLVKKYHHLNSEFFDVETYFKDHISYDLNNEKKEALDTFISLVKTLD
jgi:chorismate dehydratase